MKHFPLQDEPLAATASSQASAIASAEAPTLPSRSSDPKEIHATTEPMRFLVLAAQLALLQLVFSVYHTMERPAFLNMTAIAFGAFLVHYWLPFRFKEPFWVAVSMVTGFFLVKPHWIQLLILMVGLTFFLILRSRAPYKWRVVSVAAIFLALIYCCAAKVPLIPQNFYPLFGAIFMFRIVIYVYDVAHTREPARLLPFLSYFFLLPNYFFALFPVIDFQTMRRTYYQRDIHEIAQQGIHWMARGAIHLMLYKLVTYFNDAYLPDRVTSFGALVASMVLTFLLYLNVSGQFHLIIGILHLFGYDLPETHRRYLLSSSIMDFWRRINIYWKDFMVKIVYFPVYFRLRKKGDVRAQVIATAAVFLVTWALHSYQFFWIRGEYEVNWPDTIFWSVLGLLVIVNVLLDSRRKRRRPDVSWRGRAVHAVQVLGTFMVITTLWSLWSAPSVHSWVYLMTHWIKGAQ
jgi:D-alanyl-lipoteichoic acid acyltransferase DltB (MBOAT superfamily)